MLGDSTVIVGTIIMHTETAEKSLAVPAEWTDVRIPEVDTHLYNGTHVYVPAHDRQIATRYPTFEDGSLVADMKQSKVAKFLNEYNKAHGTNFRYPTLSEDEAIRDQLGKEHPAFDENFERNGCPSRWGYIADFTRPYGDGTEGIGQRLVTRIAGWRLPDGDVELGAITIAPDGMVPALSRKLLEKMIGAEGLRRLEKLRGREIYENGEDVVDVRNSLGYPQLTFGHDERYNDGIIVPHSHHVYAPAQDSGERVAVRDAHWDPRDELGCFGVILDFGPDSSNSYRSFPLVRGEPVEVTVARPAIIL